MADDLKTLGPFASGRGEIHVPEKAELILQRDGKPERVPIAVGDRLEVIGDSLVVNGKTVGDAGWSLKRLCSASRDELAKPFTIQTPDGTRWFTATDGCMMLAFSSPWIDPEPKTGTSAPATAAVPLRSLIDEKFSAENGIRSTVERVLAWTGPPQWQFQCRTCEGKGKLPAIAECERCNGRGYTTCTCPVCEDDHSRDCVDCGGTGDGKPSQSEFLGCGDCVDGFTETIALGGGEPHAGRIADIVVDKRRLARLAAFVSGPCELWPSANSVGYGGRALHMAGDGWHATLMCFRDDPVGEDFVP